MPNSERELVAVSRESCTIDVLTDILGLYAQHVWQSPEALERIIHMTPAWLIHESSVQTSQTSDWRLGSFLTPHSKLWIRGTAYQSPNIFFSCSSNLGRQITPRVQKKAEKMEQAFKLGVETYLTESGLAIPFYKAW